MRTERLVVVLGICATLCACGDGILSPGTEPLRIDGIAGWGQTDTVLATLAVPLQVRVVRGGRPAGGVVVHWYVDDMGDFTRVTDRSGVASVRWRFGSSAGAKSASAWLEPNGTPVEFRGSATPGRPVALTSPDPSEMGDQVGQVAQALPFDYRVRVTDAYGNGISDSFEIEWNVVAGGGSIEPIPAAADSDPHIYARHTLGLEEGTNEVTATAPELPGAPSVTFRATSVTALIRVDGVAGVFVPDSVAVPAGSSVGWVWATSYDPEYEYAPSVHDIVFEDSPDQPLSSPQQGFGTHKRVFNAPGTYRFRCTLHSPGFVSGHVGMVTVQEQP